MVYNCLARFLLQLDSLFQSLNAFIHLFDLIIFTFDKQLAFPKLIDECLVCIFLPMSEELGKLSLKESLLHCFITSFCCICQLICKSLVLFLQSFKMVPNFTVLVLILLKLTNGGLCCPERLFKRFDFILQIIIFHKHEVQLRSQSFHFEISLLALADCRRCWSCGG